MEVIGINCRTRIPKNIYIKSRITNGTDNVYVGKREITLNSDCDGISFGNDNDYASNDNDTRDIIRCSLFWRNGSPLILWWAGGKRPRVNDEPRQIKCEHEHRKG